MWDELSIGLKYVRDQKDVLTLTMLALASTFLGVPLLTFLPVFARNVFNADVGQYSQMMAWSGIGAIAGALVVADNVLSHQETLGAYSRFNSQPAH